MGDIDPNVTVAKHEIVRWIADTDARIEVLARSVMPNTARLDALVKLQELGVMLDGLEEQRRQLLSHEDVATTAERAEPPVVGAP